MALTVAVVVACSGDSSVRRCADESTMSSSECYRAECMWDGIESNCEEAGILDCGLIAVCPQVIRHYIVNEREEEVSFDSEAADCVLASLRRSERAVHEFASISDSAIEGQSRGYTIQVLGDGTALVHHTVLGDITGAEEMVWVEFPEPNCFDGCGKNGEAFEQCLADLVALPCPTGEPVCQ